MPSTPIPSTGICGFSIKLLRSPIVRAPGTINTIPARDMRASIRFVRNILKAFFEPEMNISEKTVSPVSEAFFAIPIAPDVKKA
ncbi:hypothetical protein SDC9_193738 [bioreactor metagenome]|uniref:Uncharacterized protein n=1 Tax=bioreactor metagenome TaxID=1076179 RepID=A0A645I4C3_9ZZZZ